MEPARFSAAILDANFGSTNVTDEKKIHSMVFDTFNTITNVLQHHCGPYSSFAITHNAGDSIAEPVFTNDGINIVKSLSFLNPIQEFAKRNIAYIGSRVESKVGDGTTTGMILASSFMKYMSDPKRKFLRSILDATPYTELVSTFEQVAEDLNKTMESFNYPAGRVQDPHGIGQIAYCQAYTSSHGDVELSKAIADLFRNIPKEAWGYIFYYREGMETEKRYSVRCDTDQFVSKVTIMNKNMLNDSLGTSYRADKTDVLVYTDLIAASDEVNWTPLRDEIKNAIIDDKSLLVICPDNMDGFTRRAIMDLLTDDVKHRVAIFFHHMEHPQINDFRVLSLLTMQQDLTQKYFKLHGIQASCKGHELKLNGLYNAKYEDEVNPLVFEENYPLFKQQVDELKSIIDQAKEEATYRDTVNEITHYVSIYNRLYFTSKWMIVVGGKAYDNSAAMDVLMDTIHAVNRTLTKGYTGGANIALARSLLILKKEYDVYLKGLVGHNVTKAHLRSYIVEAFIYALQDVYDGIAFHSDVNSESPFVLLKREKNLAGSGLIFDSHYGWVISNLDRGICLANSTSGSPAPCIQPVDLVPEVIARIKEVCLKFLKADHILTLNGVYTPPKKKTWLQKLFKR